MLICRQNLKGILKPIFKLDWWMLGRELKTAQLSRSGRRKLLQPIALERDVFPGPSESLNLRLSLGRIRAEVGLLTETTDANYQS